eukprot:403366324
MRYKLKLVKQMKNNFINLPKNSPLRQSIPTRSFTMDSNNCSPVKLQLLSGNSSSGEGELNNTFYFGFANGISEDSSTVEISEDLGLLLNLEDGDLVQCSLEYSFEKLKKIELEPLTADDFEIIEKNSEYVEDQLLNQIGVFYNEQKLIIFMNYDGVGSTFTRLKCKISGSLNDSRQNKSQSSTNQSSTTSAKCYFLTVDSELYIQPKIREQQQSQDNQNQPIAAENIQKDLEKQSLNIKKPLVKQQTTHKLRLIGSTKESNFDQIIVSEKLYSSNFQDQELVKVSIEPRKGIQQENAKVNYEQFAQMRGQGQQQISLLEIQKLDKTKVQQQQQYPLNLLAILQTNIEFLRNGINLHESQKDLTFKLVRDLFYGYLSEKTRIQSQLIINEGTIKFDKIVAQKIYGDSLVNKIKDIFINHQESTCLLYGPQQVGKTFVTQNLIIEDFQKNEGYFIQYIDCNKISTHISSQEQIDIAVEYLNQKYQECLKMKPSLMILDNLNALCSAISNDEQLNLIEQVKSQKVAKFLIKNVIEKEQVQILGIVRHYMSLNSKLLEVGCFDQMLEMQPPSKEQRYTLIKDLLAPSQYQGKEIVLQKQAQMTEYFMAKDIALSFRDIIQEMEQQQIHAVDGQPNYEKVFEESITQYKSSCFPQTQSLSDSVPDWEHEIGGLKMVKEQVEEIFGITQRYSLFFKGQRANQGLLLYGPPGCGKTYIAGSIAKKFNINFISVKGPELLNKYIGASEQNVRELFERATASKPSILFFDEFDSLVPRRGSGTTSVTDRIVNQFLCYLDGVEGRDGVFVMAATSRPDLVDVALLRPGRVDKSVYCGFPLLEERKEIINVYLRKFNFKPKDPENVEKFVDYIASRTENFTSADIKGLVQNSQLGKMSKILKESEGSNQQDEDPDFSINEEDILENLKVFVKGINDQERRRFLGIYAKYQDKGGNNSAEQILNQKQIQQ